MKFAIAIEAGSDKNAYGVAVPDLPGCFSAGDTVEEAFDNAVEAIEAYVETLAEDGKGIPETCPLSDWQKDRGVQGLDVGNCGCAGREVIWTGGEDQYYGAIATA